MRPFASRDEGSVNHIIRSSPEVAISGTTPIVAPDQIIFVLGDFRGDVWIRDV